MKQFFLVLSLVTTVVLSSFAHPTFKNDPLVEKSFRQLFAGASNVSWSKEEGSLLRASFTWGDHHTIAFFDKAGNMVGSIRGLFFSQLPLSVMRSVKNSFKDHIVIEVREISNEEGVSYTLLTEYNDKKYKIRLDGLGGVIEKGKIKK